MTWTLPALGLLEPVCADAPEPANRSLTVLSALTHAGVDVEEVTPRVRPQIMQYLVKLPAGGDPKKVDRAIDNVSLAVGEKARYAGVQGGHVVIEVNRAQAAPVALRSVIEHVPALIRLGLPLGVAWNGPIAAPLTEMPHLLVAGTTGSGKSAFLVSMLTALLLRNTPDELRLTLVDPKRVELTMFEGLPHLTQPVIDETTAVGPALRRVIDVMDQRYDLFKAAGVRDLTEYNQRNGVERLPRMVVVVDELADLMLTDRGIIEKLLVRLLQLGRAAGIHLILATQRPEAKVLTGLIRSNAPARVVFATQSHHDSKVALGSVGAEKLRGQGDGLFQAPSVGEPIRFQAPLVSTADVERVVWAWRKQVPAAPVPVAQPVDSPVHDEDAAMRAAADEWRAQQVNEATSSLTPQEILADAGLSPLVVDALVQTLAERLAPAVMDALGSLSEPDKGGE